MGGSENVFSDTFTQQVVSSLRGISAQVSVYTGTNFSTRNFNSNREFLIPRLDSALVKRGQFEGYARIPKSVLLSLDFHICLDHSLTMDV